MKKLYMMLAAIFIACTSFSASAVQWWISGAFNNWTHAQIELTPVDGKNGVFSTTLETLSGEFLICQGTKGNPDWNNKVGTNGQKVLADTPYTYKVGGGNFVMDGTVANPTVTLDTTAGTLLVAGEAKENEYSEVYLIGDINGGGWNENITSFPLTLKAGASNVYEGTYTFTGASNYFKMKAGSLVYGTGGADIVVELNKQYTAAQSGNAFSIGAGQYTFSYTLDKNADTGVLTVTGSGADNTFENVYIVGDINGSGWSEDLTNFPLVKKEGADNTWTGTYSFSAANNYFKFRAGLYVLGTGGEDIAVQIGNSYTASPSGNAFSLPAGKYTFDFVIEPNATTATFTVAGEATLPETLYILGNVNGATWAANNGYQLTAAGDGVFTAANVAIGSEMGTGNGYFSFATNLGGSADDWSGINARYGATESDKQASLTEPNAIQAGENAFVIPQGTYTFTVDLKNLTLTLEETKVPVELPETLYMIGNIDGGAFSATKGLEMTKAYEGVFTANNVNITKADANEFGYFSFATKLMTTEPAEGEPWDLGTRFGASADGLMPAIDDNTALSLSENAFRLNPGEYNISVDINTMTLYVTQVSVSFPEHLYIIGNVNAQGWVATNGIELKNLGNGKYEIKKLELLAAEGTESAYFAFCTALMTSEPAQGEPWQMGTRYGAPANDTPAEIGEYGNQLTVTEYSFMVEAPVQYDITVDLAAMKMVINKSSESAAAIEAADGDAAYYTLQGIRVAEPADGLYIKVANGKATKVLIRK